MKYDKFRGFQLDHLGDAMTRASKEMDELYVRPSYNKDGIPLDDPYGSAVKPENKVWSKPPSTPEEEGVYYGIHIHSESNPLGLHSHFPGGPLGGGHTHGPNNRYGTHHHREQFDNMITLDGSHEHGGVHYPDGKHEHSPKNFG